MRRARSGQRGAHAGFTLVEMLVVLVLASLVVTLLMQGLVHVLNLRGRVLDVVEESREGALREHWFRDGVRAIVADIEDLDGLDHEFTGDAEGFTAVTMAPLQRDYGIPTRVTWSVSSADGWQRLRYESEDREPITVMRWRGDEGELQYLDYEGEWQDQWPPNFGDETRQLPAAILFQGEQEGRPLAWLVRIPSLKDPRPGLRLSDEIL